MKKRKLTFKDGVVWAAAQIPMNWCDSILTGKDAVTLSGPNQEIEILLHRIKARILAGPKRRLH